MLKVTCITVIISSIILGGMISFSIIKAPLLLYERKINDFIQVCEKKKRYKCKENAILYQYKK